jgi:hypothetical protein
MGIFSKPKSSKQTPSEETVRSVITKFQGWLNAYEPMEINGVTHQLKDLESFVEFLVRQSVVNEDELLLQWVSKVCVAMDKSTITESTPETLAQLVFDCTSVSMTLRKKYANIPEIVQALTVLGVASIKVCEKFPIYREALEYMRLNADKLSGK